MVELKYKSLNKKPGSLNQATTFIFKNPAIYFLILIGVTIVTLLLVPHTIIFYENDDFDLDEVKSLSDFDTNIPSPNKLMAGSHSTNQFTKSSYAKSPLPSFTKQSPLIQSLTKQGLLEGTNNSPQCNGIEDNERFDCHAQDNVSEERCNSRGCCWSPVNSTKGELGVPFCFYPAQFRSYKFVNISTTDFGASAVLENVINSTYPENIQKVKIDFIYRDENVLQIKIYDANNARFESPFPKISSSTTTPKNTSYVVNINKEKLGFSVVRQSNNLSVFDTEDVGGFIFANQLIQISARLPSRRLYGLGQQRNDFLLDLNWQRVTLLNHDMAPTNKKNLYGSHPFYLAMEDKGLASGVFLHNTNAMDVILQPLPAITYRTIGGLLDFYLFLGPSPSDVVRQYTQLIGRPFMPPYWSLGFHLCRFDYKTLEETKVVWNRTRQAGIPLDTQWNDIDYMDHYNDFTYDKTKFKGLPEFVDLLHKEGMHYIVITDPGVSGGEPNGTYPPYDEGISEGIFIKDPVEDKPFCTKVWNPKSTVIPDFFHPKAAAYWENQIAKFHKQVPFDGLWIDMNDPSTEWDGDKHDCLSSQWDHPPYLPAVDGGALYHRTLCMSARHFNNTRHYNLHNVLGSQEAVLTANALKEVRKKRPFVISRSSYPGHGHHAGIWTGDISSSWDDMAHSVSDILSFSLFGIPMSGADICGFNENTTVPLCELWSQLGAFYPFSRNHNSDDTIDQDPVALGPEVVEAARSALLIRYSLLPYLYTLFWLAHTEGETVARPLFLQFPTDEKTYTLNNQFLWGSGLLVAPLLSQDQLYPKAYLPAGMWYVFYSLKPIDSKGGDFLLSVPKGKIPLLFHGGHILPVQHPNTTTTASRKNPLGLIVPLCKMGRAKGDLYWDDGDSSDFEKGVYNYLNFTAADGKLQSNVQQWKYNTTLPLSNVKVLGVMNVVTKVEIDGTAAKFEYNPEIKVLNVTSLSVDLSKAFTLTWS